MLNVTEGVKYSRKGKAYTPQLNGVRIGEADTRAEAERILIEAVAPDLARRVDYIGRHCGEAAEKRAHRGAKLLLAGHVQRNGSGWLVESETAEGEVYHVRYIEDGGWMCECQDWLNGYNGEKYGAPWTPQGFLCKHVLAVKLSNRRGE